jgi:hypothetical protein
MSTGSVHQAVGGKPSGCWVVALAAQVVAVCCCRPPSCCTAQYGGVLLGSAVMSHLQQVWCGAGRAPTGVTTGLHLAWGTISRSSRGWCRSGVSCQTHARVIQSGGTRFGSGTVAAVFLCRQQLQPQPRGLASQPPKAPQLQPLLLWKNGSPIPATVSAY